MNSFQIALRSVRQRGLASALTTISMALGITLVVAVLSIHGLVSRQFRNNASLGYNLVVGATKGGRLQLTLNSVFYLSAPLETVDYRYYLEFVDDETRQRDLANSLDARTHELAWRTMQADQLGLGGDGLAARLSAAGALQAAAASRMDAARSGRFSYLVDFAIPLCLGDYYGRFRAVGTTPDFFNRLVVDPEGSGGFRFAAGEVFEDWDQQHGFFGAVVGATVAREMNIELGHRFSPAHGDPEGHKHDRDFVVTGILAPSGTPNDRAVFINIEGFFLMDGHSRPLSSIDPFGADEAVGEPLFQPEERVAKDPTESPDAGPDAHFAITERLPLENREVTSILVKTINPFVGGNLMNLINEGSQAQCAQPVRQIFSLLEVFVRPIQWVLLGMTVMICLVSGVSILVSIYNSMNDRRQEIAVMRALGASRWAVMTIVLLESIILSVGGGLLGWVGGHGLNVALSSAVESRTGVRLGFFDMAPPIDLTDMLIMETPLPLPAISPELLIIPGLILLAVVVGFLPAISAYRTDVARWLGR